MFFACKRPDVGGGVGRVADHETLGRVDERRRGCPDRHRERSECSVGDGRRG
jgi:hypothetical protein